MPIAIPDLVSNSYFPAVAAVELGFFKSQGMDVELEIVFPVRRAMPASRDGDVDFVAGPAQATPSALTDCGQEHIPCPPRYPRWGSYPQTGQHGRGSRHAHAQAGGGAGSTGIGAGVGARPASTGGCHHRRRYAGVVEQSLFPAAAAAGSSGSSRAG